MLIKKIIDNIYKKLKHLYEHKLDGFSLFEICIYIVICGIVYIVGSNMITMVQKRIITTHIDMLIMNQETNKMNIMGIEVDYNNNGASFTDTTLNKKHTDLIVELQTKYQNKQQK